MRKLPGLHLLYSPCVSQDLADWGSSANAGFELLDEDVDDRARNAHTEASAYIVDIREYDVPYHVRVAIDKGT
jgi:DNA polymerase elongation subunit (family B)